LGNDIAAQTGRLEAVKPTGESGSVVLPPALLAEVEAAADAEHRPVADVVQDAVKRYVRQKRWQKIRAYGEASAKELEITEEDLPRLIAESRAEQRQGGE
jgi:metal-responsive CopG/Arc/MetJ family transcriptional regulator